MSTITGQNDLFSSYQAPTLAYSKVWSATDMYFIVPTLGTYSGGTVTVTSKNHNLVTGDVVNFVSNINASNWNQSNKTITVVDSNTFTCTFGVNPGTYTYGALANQYDPITSAEKITVTCSNYSKLMFKPTVVQIEALPTGMTILVTSKAHPDASWITVATVADADGLSQVTFNPTVNLVRCSISAGTGQPIVYAQS